MVVSSVGRRVGGSGSVQEFHQKAAEDAGFDDDSDDEYEYESSSDEEDSE